MTYSVHFTNQAQTDVDNCLGYIETVLFNHTAAKLLERRIDSALDSLAAFPNAYTLVKFEPWRSRGWRQIPLGNYLMFYEVRPAQKTVYITAFLYGARDLPTILSQREPK